MAESDKEKTATQPDFVTQIFPILKQHCFDCHSETKHKGGLRLDAKVTAFAGGDSGPVVLPGKSATSPLVLRVTSTDSDERMPPKGERLPANQVALLKQ